MPESSKNKYKLAIVVPAYKAKFLREALESIVGQTDQNFYLYVFDDCSPQPLEPIFQSAMPAALKAAAMFVRFEENLGGRSLTDQWDRCVRHTKGEQWVWVFSDDDIMHPQCVAKLRQKLRETEKAHSVYRFNTLTIDEDGEVVRVNPPHPSVESPLEFAYHRLRSERVSYAPEYIFSRRAYDETGGFVPFPLGWCSDDASWIAFAGEKGICTVEGPRVKWRQSRINISGSAAAGKLPRLDAAIDYLRWLEERFKNVEHTEIGLGWKQLSQQSKSWFGTHVSLLGVPLTLSECRRVAQRMHAYWGDGVTRNFLKLLRHNLGAYLQSAQRRLRSSPL